MECGKRKRVAVIGAGTMGHSIAQVFAACEIEVNLADVRKEILDHALRLIKVNLKTLVEYGKVKEREVPSILGRIHTTTDIQAAARGTDFVLEAVVEIPENIGISLPGTGEAPTCPVYIDGEHATTLRWQLRRVVRRIPGALGRVRGDEVPAERGARGWVTVSRVPWPMSLAPASYLGNCTALAVP